MPGSPGCGGPGRARRGDAAARRADSSGRVQPRRDADRDGRGRRSSADLEDGRRLELENLEHGGVVNAASFSPDGVLVATAGDDGLARLWETDTGRLVRILRGHMKAIVALAFSPDGNWLATASADKTARIWDVHGGPQSSPRAVLRHADALTSLAFSPDGTRLVTASFDHDAIVWSVPDGKRLRVLSGHGGVVSDVAFSYDGRWIVTAGPTTAGLWQADDRWLATVPVPPRFGSPTNKPCVLAGGMACRHGQQGWHGRYVRMPAMRRRPSANRYGQGSSCRPGA